jgi:hypothetical protein
LRGVEHRESFSQSESNLKNCFVHHREGKGNRNLLADLKRYCGKVAIQNSMKAGLL